MIHQIEADAVLRYALYHICGGAVNVRRSPRRLRRMIGRLSIFFFAYAMLAILFLGLMKCILANLEIHFTRAWYADTSSIYWYAFSMIYDDGDASSTPIIIMAIDARDACDIMQNARSPF